MRNANYPLGEPIKLVCFFCPYEAKDFKDYDKHEQTHKEWILEQPGAQLTMWRK